MKIKPDSLRIIDGELHAEPIAEPIPEPVLVELGPQDVTTETDAIRFSSNPREYYDLANRLERERNELRAEVAEKQNLIELHCRDWADDDTRIKAICAKHGIATENTDDYFKSAVECVEQLAAEVERLKAACEKEFASVEKLDLECSQLKADKARLEKALARIGCYFAGTDSDHVSKKIEAVLCGKSIDEAIDDAMK